MITIVSFRRVCLEHEGCAPRPSRVTAALACHKGNSSQAQTSNQAGAQTQGVANDGSGNFSNTGTQVNKAPTLTGSNSSQNNSVNIGAGATVTDEGAVQAALNALANAQQSSQANSAQTIQAALSALSQNNNDNPQSTDTNGNATTGLGAVLANISPWQWFAGAAAIIGLVILIFRPFKKA